jgi:tetratricopeptide (TPR) repeat protein
MAHHLNEIHYHEPMTSLIRWAPTAILTLALAHSSVFAQRANSDFAQRAIPPEPAPQDTSPVRSNLSGQLLERILTAELLAQQRDFTNAFQFMLDAARRSNDGQLFQRSVQLAGQAGAGDAALQAARAWGAALPADAEAQRALASVLLNLNRPEETIEPLKKEIALLSADRQRSAIAVVPRYFGRLPDRKQAAQFVEQVLADASKNGPHQGLAWAAIGRARQSAKDDVGALQAAITGNLAQATATEPIGLALDLMTAERPGAEQLVKTYLARTDAIPEARMAYVRKLMDMTRFPDAQRELLALTEQAPKFADSWLLLGALEHESNKLDAAQAAYQRFLDLHSDSQDDSAQAAKRQAYLGLARIAQQRKDFASAQRWIDKIGDKDEYIQVVLRQAGLLAAQGQVDKALETIRSAPERGPVDRKAKLSAEAQILRDNKRYPAAYELLVKATAEFSDDLDLVYERASMAEKVDKIDEMERLFRQIIAARPDNAAAYNALGYTLADRNLRLPEAKKLIEQALKFAPGDPFITDSLGWVEFRMGNTELAAKILDSAFRQRPDAEIAAHLGEVLWVLNKRDEARSIWREGQRLAADNETLQQTMKRFNFKP